VIVYLDCNRGISAGLVLGALLDAGADAALVQRILGTVTLPRISLMRGRERVGAVAGTVASVAIGPVKRGTPLIDAVRALESGQSPLSVRTWGGGMVARLLEAEAMLRGEPLDAVPLTDPVTVAELIAVSAALAALQVVRVYAAPLGRTEGERVHSVLSPQSSVLLEEAGWPAAPGAVVTPGGAAILAALAEPGVPPLRLSAVGYGIAADTPRLLRCWVGEPYSAGRGPVADRNRAVVLTHAHPHDRGDDH
jgi:uncharacterized protein (DUF111 family)